MRIADKMNYDQVKSNLGKNRSEMADLQNQAATQKRLNKPSDDPLATTRVLATRTEISGNKQFLKSVNQARTFLEYSDQSLGELSDLLVRAKELALSQASDGSASKGTREVVATEIAQLYDQAVQVGNRKLGDRFLFGGFRTTHPPFTRNGEYRGDSGEIKIAINKDANVAMNIPGNRVFLGQKTEAPGIVEQKPPDSVFLLRGPASEPPPIPLKSGEDLELVGLANQRTEGRQETRAKTPAELDDGDDSYMSETWKNNGVNVFHTLRDLVTGLRANDKESVQESLDVLDDAVSQVVLARSELGSRVGTLNSSSESLQKGQVDAKALASNLEDADTFELVSDLNKTESTLKATLETSGKLIQPSLLDFIK